MDTTPGTRVQLKRLYSLDKEDRVQAGRGLFRRDGKAIPGHSRAEMTARLGSGIETVNRPPRLSATLGVEVGFYSGLVLEGPADAYVVLA